MLLFNYILTSVYLLALFAGGSWHPDITVIIQFLFSLSLFILFLCL
jgi:hypothetical protein